jgi:ATP-binding cassette subfamily C (CFTR/MRP) protein 1
LAKSFGGSFFLTAVMKLLGDSVKFVVPLILKELIKFFKESNSGSGGDNSPWVGYFYAFSILIIGLIQSVLLQAYWKKTRSVALHVRTSLFSELYKKTLNINPTSRKDYTVGEIVNMMSTAA